MELRPEHIDAAFEERPAITGTTMHPSPATWSTPWWQQWPALLAGWLLLFVVAGMTITALTNGMGAVVYAMVDGAFAGSYWPIHGPTIVHGICAMIWGILISVGARLWFALGNEPRWHTEFRLQAEVELRRFFGFDIQLFLWFLIGTAAQVFGLVVSGILVGLLVIPVLIWGVWKVNMFLTHGERVPLDG